MNALAKLIETILKSGINLDKVAILVLSITALLAVVAMGF